MLYAAPTACCLPSFRLKDGLETIFQFLDAPHLLLLCCEIVYTLRISILVLCTSPFADLFAWSFCPHPRRTPLPLASVLCCVGTVLALPEDRCG